uniref:G_PROTEIN_RECEP_F1_2 domain-containing protein n=1 Tax=Steinernema glaseri TaxID=37863 RepID=A0A1I8AED7_9BILA
MTADQPGGPQEVYQFSRIYLTFRAVNGGLACAMALILNILIIFGIRVLHGNSLRHFRGLLITLSVLDILHALVLGVTGMGFHFYKGRLLVVVTGLISLGPPELSFYAYIFYLETLIAFFILQLILFLTRYVIICLPEKVPTMTKTSFIRPDIHLLAPERERVLREYTNRPAEDDCVAHIASELAAWSSE